MCVLFSASVADSVDLSGFLRTSRVCTRRPSPTRVVEPSTDLFGALYHAWNVIRSVVGKTLLLIYQPSLDGFLGAGPAKRLAQELY